MKRSHLSFGPFLSWSVTMLAAFFLTLPATGAQAGADSRADFEWFGKLGFADVKACPLARVATGEWSQTGSAPRQNHFVTAFLLATNGPQFTVLTLDLFQRSFTNSPPATAPYNTVGFEFLNLTDESHRRIRELEAEAARINARPLFNQKLSVRAQVFVLAWGCWRNGLQEVAQELYDQAKKLPDQPGAANPDGDFRRSLGRDLGHAMMWRAVLAFGDLSISRPELLERFEAIPAHYPHSEHRERARAISDTLKRMIAEDARHPMISPGELERLPAAEKVPELIFRLRDQNGHQMSQPGSCDIFEDWRGTNSPAHQLVRLGYDAVPGLIAALDSDTLTRSVGFGRDFVFSHYVLTVGECAHAILRRITGRHFYPTHALSNNLSEAARASAIRKTAEAWWAEFQKSGEQQMLIAGVEAADNDSLSQADLLREKYPGAAGSALIRGAQAATNSWIRARLVDQVAKLGQERGIEFMKEELVHGPALPSRVAAAFGLRSIERETAIEAITREWEHLPNQPQGEIEGWEAAVEFLGSSGSIKAVSSLIKDLRSRSIEQKCKVIEVLGETNGLYSDYASEPFSAQTLDAVEHGLVACLKDTEERIGLSGMRYGKEYWDPRACDMAGLFLNLRWPDRYAFDLNAPLSTRDRQRIECINASRQEHHQPLLPLPQRPSTRVEPQDSAKVTLIEWMPETVPPPNGFAARVAGFQDQLLNADALVGLLTDFVKNPEPGAPSLELKAVKDANLSGVRLILKLLPPQLTRESSGRCGFNQRVLLGHESLYNTSGGASLDYASDPAHWGDLRAAMKRAIAGSPATPFEISVLLKVRRNQ